MEKYSVLLVDDEEDVIQIIMKKMDWESMGFQIAGTHPTAQPTPPMDIPAPYQTIKQTHIYESSCIFSRKNPSSLPAVK